MRYAPIILIVASAFLAPRAHAQSPEAIAKCRAMLRPFQPDCFRAIGATQQPPAPAASLSPPNVNTESDEEKGARHYRELATAIKAFSDRARACIRLYKNAAYNSGVAGWDGATEFFKIYCFKDYDDGWRATGTKTDTAKIFRTIVGLEIGAISEKDLGSLSLD